MDVLSRFYKSLTGGARQIQRHETDIVFPVHSADQAKVIRESIISYTFRFNDVLQPEKLHDSLIRLVETEDWRKIGGRLRKNVRSSVQAQVSRLMYVFRGKGGFRFMSQKNTQRSVQPFDFLILTLTSASTSTH